MGPGPEEMATQAGKIRCPQDRAGVCLFPGAGGTFPGTSRRRRCAMTKRFVSEAIEPVVETCDTRRMAAGEPGLPRAFRWREEMVQVTTVLRSWRTTGPCTHGSPERYVRKHWYEVATADHGILTLYFDRQPRRSRRESRWWLFSQRPPTNGAPPPNPPAERGNR